jgi:hypothetical protein
MKFFTEFEIIERAWSANLKMVWYVLLRPLRPELNIKYIKYEILQFYDDAVTFLCFHSVVVKS